MGDAKPRTATVVSPEATPHALQPVYSRLSPSPSGTLAQGQGPGRIFAPRVSRQPKRKRRQDEAANSDSREFSRRPGRASPVSCFYLVGGIYCCFARSEEHTSEL